MNRHNLTRTIFGAALLFAFAACTQDEPTDGNGTSLPEGKYPLEIGSISLAAEVDEQPWRANAPQTRVSENPDGNSSAWETGDVIYAKTEGAQEAGTFRIGDAQGSLTVQKPTYWTKTTENVTAWYPAEGTVELADQSNKLAYVLQAVSGNASYNQPIELGFTHQLAKVRVTLQGNQAKDVTDVKIKSYTACTNTQGAVSTDGATEGWITMMEVTRGTKTAWEANVVPDHAITAFQVNGVEGTLDNGGITPLAAKVNSVMLTAGKLIVVEGGETIDQPGDYILKGFITSGITLNGDGINLTLDNVVAYPNGDVIKVTGGSPTIIVKGPENHFNYDNGNGAGILISQGASVTIKGATNNASDSRLVIKAHSSSRPGIGSADETSCGDITIENVTLDVTGGFSGGAAIGTSGGFGSGCGDIKITNCIINATAGAGAAAIGMGYSIDCGYSIGAITIIDSQLNIKTQNWGDIRGAGIGLGGIPDHSYTTTGYQVCGKITITTTETKETFFSRFDTGDGFKAGKTSNSQYWSLQQWSGITFNGETLADGNSDGYK